MITWHNRNGFIEMAARACIAGDSPEYVWEQLGKYAEPYNRGTVPKIGNNQKGYTIAAINRRIREIMKSDEKHGEFIL